MSRPAEPCVVTATAEHAAEVARALAGLGLWVTPLTGRQEDCRSFLVAPHSAAVDAEALRQLAGVTDVQVAAPMHPLVDGQPSRITVAGVSLTSARAAVGPPTLVAGPCSVESLGMIEELAAELADLGARFLRGGAFKPRTSPYAFQGLGAPALGWLRQAADAHGLGVVTEALSVADAPAVAEHADLVQVGSRNMQHYPLLRAVGRAGKPVLLKRGLSATVEEWLLAAEYCLQSGAPAVVFCERGVRGFDTSTRNVLDLGSVALLGHVLGQPVVVDPSHAAGRRDLVGPLMRAAVAAGATAVMVEVHPSPGHARSDGPQALTPAQLRDAWAQVVAPHVGSPPARRAAPGGDHE